MTQQAQNTAGRIFTLWSGAAALPPVDGFPRGDRTVPMTEDVLWEAGPHEWILPPANLASQDIGARLILLFTDGTNEGSNYVGTITGVLGDAAVVTPDGTNVTNPTAGTITIQRGGTPPTVTLSPQTPTALETTGFMIMLKPPTALTPAGEPEDGFAVTLWVRDPSDGSWGSGVTVQMGYSEWWVTGDVDACDLYVQIEGASTPGYVNVHIAES